VLVTTEGIWRRVFQEHWQQFLALLVISVSVYGAFHFLNWRWLAIPSQPLTIVGAALGIMLGFRSNEAYNRYAEARALWGALVNASRNLTREVLTLLRPEHPEDARELQHQIICHQIAFVHALRCQLWRHDPFPEIQPFVSAEELERLKSERNVPNAILQGLAERIQEAWKRGWIHDLHVGMIHKTLGDITDAQGGCERIKNTPIPRSYTYVAHRIVFGFCCALPFGLVDLMGAGMPFASLLVAFTFLMLDRFGKLIEDPFCTTYSGLPLLSITRTIEVNLRQRLGQTSLPPDLKPVDGVLY
jgi:ion channel-forming bestrophin family protein